MEFTNYSLFFSLVIIKRINPINQITAPITIKIVPMNSCDAFATMLTNIPVITIMRPDKFINIPANSFFITFSLRKLS